ncbi:hypothetical protein COHA_000166 [Chlorella ohadii]|uniref:DNA helicase n=1 Tax=Chlorella ohadii TaxID=2649997 RepID=A0AAD5E3B2_9CHLO|nr:hypothetical protein COHA_000166 [Chlorella ohadii]
MGSAEREAEVFVPWLLQAHAQELTQILHAPDPDGHYGVPISLAELAATNHGAAELLLKAPRQVLPLLDLALVLAQDRLRERAGHRDPEHGPPTKPWVHARLHGLALHQDVLAREVCPPAGGVAAPHIDRLVTLVGTVTKAGPVKALEARRVYECGRCHHRFVVQADIELGGTVVLPPVCPSESAKPCRGTSFRHVEGGSLFTNWQEVRVQEQSQGSVAAGAPRSLTVLLQDELADQAQVGDDVEVTGVVIRQFGPMFPGVRCQVGLALQATSLTVANERKAAVEVTPEAAALFGQYWQAHGSCPLRGRNKIIASVCPELHGLFTVKLATLLMLIGGVERQEPGGAHIRGEVHMLLVGDPGTGKSQFQKYVAKLAPRAVVTSGRASSAVGLTAAAVHDGAGWALEAGALVLADGGVCCIDEFDGIPEKDRAAIHEAMEQQSTHVAKAGMMVSLHTRCAVFATCNPGRNQRYNPRVPLASQLNISGPLLSRFDVVILLLDQMSPEWDETVADHILQTHHRRGGSKQADGSGAASGGRQRHQPAEAAEVDSQGWPLALLRQYVAWAKAAFTPVLSEEAEQLMAGYYQLRRQAEGRQASSTTVRMLESLVRVAQAHARLMARGEVLLQDAVVAVWLIDACSDGHSVLGDVVGAGSNGGHQPFPDDPDAEYARLEQAVTTAVLSQREWNLLTY